MSPWSLMFYIISLSMIGPIIDIDPAIADNNTLAIILKISNFNIFYWTSSFLYYFIFSIIVKVFA